MQIARCTYVWIEGSVIVVGVQHYCKQVKVTVVAKLVQALHRCAVGKKDVKQSEWRKKTFVEEKLNQLCGGKNMQIKDWELRIEKLAQGSGIAKSKGGSVPIAI